MRAGRGCVWAAYGAVILFTIAVPGAAQTLSDSQHDEAGDVVAHSAGTPVDLPRVDILRVTGNVSANGTMGLTMTVAAGPGPADAQNESAANTTITHYFLVDRAGQSNFTAVGDWDFSVQCLARANEARDVTCNLFGIEGNATATWHETTLHVVVRPADGTPFEHLIMGGGASQMGAGGVVGFDFTPNADPLPLIDDGQGGGDRDAGGGFDWPLVLRWGALALGFAFLFWLRKRRRDREQTRPKASRKR